MSRMFDRVEKGDLALGTVLLANGPEWVEILGHAGMDFVCIDMMLTAIDWNGAANMVRAANRYEVTPWIRLQGYPWAGGFDRRTVADVLRALSIGAEVVTMSLDTPEEVEAVLHPTTDWHRRVYIDAGLHEAEMERKLERETLVFPLIESSGAARRIDEILSVKGLRAIFLGMGDLPMQLGYDGPQDPRMRAFVERTVNVAHTKGVSVIINTGRLYEPEAIAESVRWYWEHGIQIVWISYPTWVVQRYYEKTLGLARERCLKG